MAIISIISLVLAIAAVFISISSMRDQEKLTDQISKVILDKVIKMIDEEINSTNKKIKKRTKKVEKND